MAWSEHIGAHRVVLTACWLVMAVFIEGWRWPLGGVAAARRRRGTRVRVGPVSRAWLREHEVESTKRDV
jgi:hypothetical protein